MWAKGEKSSSITAVPVGNDHSKWPGHQVTDNKKQSLLPFLFTKTEVLSHAIAKAEGPVSPQDPAGLSVFLLCLLGAFNPSAHGGCSFLSGEHLLRCLALEWPLWGSLCLA